MQGIRFVPVFFFGFLPSAAEPMRPTRIMLGVGQITPQPPNLFGFAARVIGLAQGRREGGLFL
jgi:hypothetical protein